MGALAFMPTQLIKNENRWPLGPLVILLAVIGFFSWRVPHAGARVHLRLVLSAGSSFWLLRRPHRRQGAPIVTPGQVSGISPSASSAVPSLCFPDHNRSSGSLPLTLSSELL